MTRPAAPVRVAVVGAGKIAEDRHLPALRAMGSYRRFDFADATVELAHLYGYGDDDWTWTPAPDVTDRARVDGWRPTEGLHSGHAAPPRHP
jgi:hypothetical protein